MTPRPATGKTPVRGIRVPDPLWHRAQARAAERGETLTEVVLRALHRYLRDTEPKGASPDGGGQGQ